MLHILLLIACLLVAPAAARAQLATSFYNVTGIQTRTLPNAVQITIQTDGTVAFGGDLAEFIDFGTGQESSFQIKPVTSLRLRLLRARARLPAFVDIGAYPVDSAVVTLGTEPLERPFFGSGGQNQADPRVDIQFRFFVPVTVQRFIVDRGSGEDSGDGFESGINFGELLGPRALSVELGPDRRSIIITLISDRVESNKNTGIRRSPPETHKHRLLVSGLGGEALRVDALHAPLARLLDELSAATGVPLLVREGVQEVDVSLVLPRASLPEILRILATGYGLTVTPRAPEEGGGFTLGRGGTFTVTERLPLQNLSPERARLLFPDFLLPLLRADIENNSLVASGTPELVARLKSDLVRLDRPRPQVRIEAAAYEFSSQEEARFALRATRVLPGESESVDTATGEVSLRIAEGQKKEFSLAVDALALRGRARLAATPFVVVASGEQGTLFLGQSRYVTVLQQRGRRQIVQALRLPIGYSLSVLPTLGREDDITLELNPRISTVDAVEAGTGLPTLGIREVNSVIRLRPGETVILAGLDSDLSFDTRRFGASARNRPQTALVLLITAKKV